MTDPASLVDPAQDAAVGGLLERLERLVPPTGFGSTRSYPRNPDGPEAASVIRRLTAERDALREALEGEKIAWKAERNVAEKAEAAASEWMTRAADLSNQLRGASDALGPFAHVFTQGRLPKDDTVHVTALNGQWIATVEREAFWKARAALAMQGEGS